MGTIEITGGTVYAENANEGPSPAFSAYGGYFLISDGEVTAKGSIGQNSGKTTTVITGGTVNIINPNANEPAFYVNSPIAARVPGFPKPFMGGVYVYDGRLTVDSQGEILCSGSRMTIYPSPEKAMLAYAGDSPMAGAPFVGETEFTDLLAGKGFLMIDRACANFVVSGADIQDGVDYRNTGTLEILTEKPMTVSMASGVAVTSNNILVSSPMGSTLTLDNVHIDRTTNGSAAPFAITGGAGNVDLSLTGSSYLYAPEGFAGLQKESGNGKHLKISDSAAQGLGMLTAVGGTYGAGIGGGENGDGVNIEIAGGLIKAYTRDPNNSARYGAGIGGGRGGDAENITVSGGIVLTESGGSGAGIGGGAMRATNQGEEYGGNARNITVSGGIVSASGGNYGAGIGGGRGGGAEGIVVSGGEVITAGAFSLGSGYMGSTGTNTGTGILIAPGADDTIAALSSGNRDGGGAAELTGSPFSNASDGHDISTQLASSKYFKSNVVQGEPVYTCNTPNPETVNNLPVRVSAYLPSDGQIAGGDVVAELFLQGAPTLTGRHTITLKSESGGIEQTLTVDVPGGGSFFSGSYPLTFKMTGEDISDMTLTNSFTPSVNVTPKTAGFDKKAGSADHKDIALTITQTAGYTFSGISCNGRLLNAGDYSFGGGDGMLIIKKEFLATLDVGEYRLELLYGTAINSSVALIVTDSTPVLPSIQRITTLNVTVGNVFDNYQYCYATGTEPITWSLESGDFPPGLTLAPDGSLSGSPTTPGVYIFFVQAENSAGSITMRAQINVYASQQPISIAEIQGVPVPQAGTTPVTSVYETPEYTGTVSWDPPSSRFATSVPYTAIIKLFPKFGYTLEGVPANFFILTGAETVSYDPDTGLISAEFPSTGKENMPDIQITGHPDNVTITEGNSALLKVSASSAGILSYQWYENANFGTIDGEAISGATGESYTTPASLAEGQYYYYCVISAGGNTVTSQVVRVTVLAASSAVIRVTGQPEDVTTTRGGISGSLHVAAEASEPSVQLAYQWYTCDSLGESDMPISGAVTASYSLPAGLSGGMHYYYCIVSGTGGVASVKSRTATVNVGLAPPPQIPFLEVINPAPIIGVKNGAANTAAGLGLPGQVEISTGIGHAPADVTWDIDAIIYDPMIEAEQTFTVAGTVILPNGVSNEEGRSLAASISVTVAAKDAVTVTGITIQTPPDTVNYESGDVLDLMGLTVMLSYSDSSTKPVVLTDFADEGITATPANGTALSASQGKVVLQAGSFSAEQVIAVAERFIPVQSITDVPDGAEAGAVLTLSGTVFPANATKTEIVWSISNPGNTGAAINSGVFSAVNPGTAYILATVMDGAKDRDFEQVFPITVSPSHVNVIAITNGPTEAVARVPLTLAGTVVPENATNRRIKWGLEDSGTAGGKVENGVFTAQTPGESKVRATIQGGLSSDDYVQVFTLTVSSGGSDPDPGPGPGPEPWKNPFIDVFEDNWFYKDVAYVHINDLFNGTSDTTFLPQKPMSRAMLVTVLWRLAGEPSAGDLENPFKDVAENRYYTDAVLWAAKSGIVQGYGNNLFGTNDSVRRADLCVMFMRYAKFVGVELPEIKKPEDFADADEISAYAMEAVMALYRAGIIEGKGNGIFDAKGTATRAEVATMLHRFIEAVK